MNTNITIKILTISLLIIAISLGVMGTQKLAQKKLHQQSAIDVEIHSYDPGLQSSSIEQIELLPSNKWLTISPKSYNNLYIKQTLWERVTVRNNTKKSKTIVVSERGNYVTDHKIYSDLDTSLVSTRFSNENFKQQFILPAKTQTTLFIEKQGYQLNNFSTQVYDYPTYRLAQLLSIICSTWAYGAILGVGMFYFLSIQSRQTQLSERLVILGYIITAILVIAIENNFHSLVAMSAPNAEIIGQKISLPLILAPLSSYILLRTYNITNKRHPLHQLCFVFFIATLLLAYCLINNYIVPFIYLGFTTLAFIHQFCWLQHARKSTQLNSLGQLASLGFILITTANHILVILLANFPELTSARTYIINAYYLLCIACAITMLNDKNIIISMQDLQQKNAQARIKKNREINIEIQKISSVIDNLLQRTQQLIQPDTPSIAQTINNLRLLQMETIWRRQFINLETTNNLLYESYARENIQKKDKKESIKQTFATFGNMLKLHENKSLQLKTSHAEDIQQLTLQAQKNHEIIMVIDDNSNTALMTAKAIQNNGRRIEIFTNPLQAIQYAAIKASSPSEHDNIYAVISDYEMPEMDGLMTTEEIKQQYLKYNKKSPKLILFSSAIQKITPASNIKIIDKSKANLLNAALNDV